MLLCSYPLVNSDHVPSFITLFRSYCTRSTLYTLMYLLSFHITFGWFSAISGLFLLCDACESSTVSSLSVVARGCSPLHTSGNFSRCVSDTISAWNEFLKRTSTARSHASWNMKHDRGVNGNAQRHQANGESCNKGSSMCLRCPESTLSSSGVLPPPCHAYIPRTFDRCYTHVMREHTQFTTYV